MTMIWYTLIVFLATILGAVSGIGGGIIIKPAFDLLGRDGAVVIGSYSTIAVFFMCLVALYRQSKSGLVFDKHRLISLSIGSLLGGMLGELLFRQVIQNLANHRVVGVQSLLLFFVLLVVLVLTRLADRLPRFVLQNPLGICLLAGMISALSVFIGIGGGPLNVIALAICFALTPKEAVPYSLAMIFLAQLPKLIAIGISPPKGLSGGLVLVLLLTALCGGSIGTRLNRRLSDQAVKGIYSAMMLGLLLLSAYQILRFLS